MFQKWTSFLNSTIEVFFNCLGFLGSRNAFYGAKISKFSKTELIFESYAWKLFIVFHQNPRNFIFGTAPPIFAKFGVTQEPEFSHTCDFRRKLENHKFFHFRSLPSKTNDSIFRKSTKPLFLGHFCPFLAIFAKMWI